MRAATAVRRIRTMEEALKPGSSVVYALRKTHSSMERLTRSELRGAFGRVGEQVSAAAYSMGGLPLSEAEGDNPMDDERIRAIIDAAHLDTWKARELRPIFEKAWSRSSLATEQALEKHGIYAAVRQRIANQMKETGATRTGLMDVDAATKAALYHVIELGQELGLSSNELGRLIEHFVPAGHFIHAGSGYRSRMIARTETLEASRQSSLAVYEESPVVSNVMAFDGTEHDEECAQRNGEIFTIPEAQLESASTHPQCVLTWAPV